MTDPTKKTEPGDRSFDPPPEDNQGKESNPPKVKTKRPKKPAGDVKQHTKA